MQKICTGLPKTPKMYYRLFLTGVSSSVKADASFFDPYWDFLEISTKLPDNRQHASEISLQVTYSYVNAGALPEFTRNLS
jgi:hypothetical protein